MVGGVVGRGALRALRPVRSDSQEEKCAEEGRFQTSTSMCWDD
jgi:hypothetical protein